MLGSPKGGRPMKSNRRTFLKTAGAAIAAGTASTLLQGSAAAGAGPGAGAAGGAPGPAPKGMTFLTIKKGNELSLGVKTPKGILDVKAAARLLKRPGVPTLIDEVIQRGDQGLTALVQEATAGGAAK